jgi:hypothetical protein
MINHFYCLKHLHKLVSLIIAFCLIFGGMRVPDISRPHRAKPKYRAVIENKTNSCQTSIKKIIDFVALVPSITGTPAPQPAPADFQSRVPASYFSPLFPNASRAPPFVLS